MSTYFSFCRLFWISKFPAPHYLRRCNKAINFMSLFFWHFQWLMRHITYIHTPFFPPVNSAPPSCDFNACSSKLRCICQICRGFYIGNLLPTGKNLEASVLVCSDQIWEWNILMFLHWSAFLGGFVFVSYELYTKTCSETSKCSTFSHSIFCLWWLFNFPQQWSNILDNVKWSTLNSGYESIRSFISLFIDNNFLVTVARK